MRCFRRADNRCSAKAFWLKGRKAVGRGKLRTTHRETAARKTELFLRKPWSVLRLIESHFIQEDRRRRRRIIPTGVLPKTPSKCNDVTNRQWKIRATFRILFDGSQKKQASSMSATKVAAFFKNFATPNINSRLDSSLTLGGWWLLRRWRLY